MATLVGTKAGRARQKGMSSLRAACTVVVAVSFLGLLPAHAGERRAWSGTLADGVVLDMAVPAVFVMSSDPPGTGRIPTADESAELVAVNPRTGKRLWRTRKAAKPIVVVRNKLVAIGAADTAYGIIILDTRTGKVAARCARKKNGPTAIPIQNRLGTVYRSKGALVGGRPIIIATTDTSYVGGPAPSPEMLAAAQSHTETAVEVDVSTGCAHRIEVPDLPGPLLVDDPRAKAFVKAQGGVYTSMSADGTHVMTTGHPVLDNGVYTYRWHMLELSSGKTVDLSGRPFAPGAFFVAGDVIVSVRGGVEGVSRSGRSLWTELIRSTGYIGPYPP